MSSFDDLGNTSGFFHKTLLVTIDHNGVILDTDQNHFNWKIDNSIYQTHPFFEVIKLISENSDPTNKEYTFSNVSLKSSSEEDVVSDIRIYFRPKEIVLSITPIEPKENSSTIVQEAETDEHLKKEKIHIQKTKEFKSSFLANISHQIKTPLTGIIGFTEILENSQLNFEQRELVKIIKKESDYLNTVASAVLKTPQVEATKSELSYDRIDISEFMDDIFEKYRYLAKTKNIDFELFVDTNIPTDLLGDRLRIRQILMNLLDSTIRSTREGDKLELRVQKNYQRANKTSLNFEINSFAKSETDSKKPSISYKLLSERQKVTDNELELAIAENLTDLLNGEIKIGGNIKHGRSFELKLLLRSDTSGKQERTEPAKKYNLPNLDRKFRILLVDDKEVNQYLIMKILISHGGFYVDVANNGQEALSSIEKKAYDLVIMDIMMSPIDGHTATNMIRNNYDDDQISKVPIIGFTAKHIKGEKEKCYESGMNDFIAKPIKKDELINKIAKQLSKVTAAKH